MNIDKINHVGQIQALNDKATAKAHEAKNPALGQDSVSISQAALQAREAALAQKAVAAASDVRAEKVREAKEKLARGDYDTPSNEMLSRIAARLTSTVKGV